MYGIIGYNRIKGLHQGNRMYSLVLGLHATAVYGNT